MMFGLNPNQAHTASGHRLHVVQAGHLLHPLLRSLCGKDREHTELRSADFRWDAFKWLILFLTTKEE